MCEVYSETTVLDVLATCLVFAHSGILSSQLGRECIHVPVVHIHCTSVKHVINFAHNMYYKDSE